jgi:dihydroxyacetone kinase-like predicted kinase
VEASSRRARIVPTESIPTGIAAATAFNPLATADRNLADMDAAARACWAGEVARAERDTATEAGPVQAGDWLAMAGGQVVAVGDRPETVATGLARSLADGAAELLTLVTGSEAPADEVERVVEALRRAFPGLDLEVLDGGQHRYPYLIGAE